jgi:hypothetical protein
VLGKLKLPVVFPLKDYGFVAANSLSVPARSLESQGGREWKFSRDDGPGETAPRQIFIFLGKIIFVW